MPTQEPIATRITVEECQQTIEESSSSTVTVTSPTAPQQPMAPSTPDDHGTKEPDDSSREGTADTDEDEEEEYSIYSEALSCDSDAASVGKSKSPSTGKEKLSSDESSQAGTIDTEEEDWEGMSVGDIEEPASNDWVSSLNDESGEKDGATKRNASSRRFSFGGSFRNNSGKGISPIANIDYGYGDATPDACCGSDRKPQRKRRRSSLRDSLMSVGSMLSCVFGKGRTRSRRMMFAKNGRDQNFRISKDAASMKGERVEAFFYNHGMEIALGLLYLALNVLVGAHGAYQFTASGGFVTDNEILRVTLPIARAGGRLVTLNCAILLLTACKWTWTCIRTHLVPILPIGFPIDNVMPKYHRYVALTVIVSGCIIHTLPQIANYATKAIEIDDGSRIWTYGKGFATRQLLITGTLLTVIFSTFFLTTLKAFRKTAAGFRWFWFFHVGGIATAYPLLIVHGTCRGHPIFMYFALLPLALYLFDVAMRRLKNVSTAKVLEWRTHDDQGQHITELVLECPSNFNYTPGQYAELKFAPISTTEYHPFTIASAPNERQENGKCSRGSDSDSCEEEEEMEEGDVIDLILEDGKKAVNLEGKKKLVFYIKATGRWTEALYNYVSVFDLSKAREAPKVTIRGPHGAPAMNYFEYRHLVVIGSGVGMTPLLSIWKYLMNHATPNRFDSRRSTLSLEETLQGSTLTFGSSKKDEDSLSLPYGVDPLESTYNADDDDDDEEEYDYDDELSSSSKIRSACVFLEKILESMTASMVLLCLFVTGETVTILMQMFGHGVYAQGLGAILSLVALAVHGGTVLVSAIATKPSLYFRLFKCWLEIAIIVADSFALSVSLSSLLLAQRRDCWGARFLNARMDPAIFRATESSLKLLSSNRDDFDCSGDGDNGDANAYFLFFGVVVALHAVRIFHIFYTTLKPAVSPTTPSSSSKDRSPAKKKELCSIQGVLINRHYSGMRFAAKSLSPPAGDGPSKLFSMDFYGTREKKYDDEQGSATTTTTTDGRFHAGRPDWAKVFRKAIAKAHSTGDSGVGRTGESVGVFFCGAPAIAKELQKVAAEVTAQHQFAAKHLDGRPCKCKLIVHSENF